MNISTNSQINKIIDLYGNNLDPSESKILKKEGEWICTALDEIKNPKSMISIRERVFHQVHNLYWLDNFRTD